MSKNTFRLFSLFLFAGFLICLFANFSDAQSGRRTTAKPQTPPTEISIPEPKPTATPKVPTVEPLHKLRVFGNIRSTSASQFIFPERMQRWVVERLSNSPLLDVSFDSNATLGEAKKIAKEATDFFVVLVELDESINPAASRQGNSRGEIMINYFVLTPGTGKTKYSGNILVYPEFISNNDNIYSSKRLCYPEVSQRDLYLLNASFETAERIMSKFKIPLPPYKCASKI